MWAGTAYLYSDPLRPGRSENQIAVGRKFSAPVQNALEALPASCTMGTGSLSWDKADGTWR